MEATRILSFAAAGALGAFTWLPAEYWIHRKLGHETKVRNPFLTEHREHHRVRLYFAPASRKGLAAVLLLTLLTALLSLAMSPWLAAAYSFGFAAQYLAYELFHRRIHTHAPRSRWGMTLRKHHFAHHFGATHLNYGVSTRLFDRLGRTLLTPTRVRIPRKMANDWLLGADGQLRPEFAEHFELTGT
jgi:4-hydroxysphinganine ceramide fatty acyl 2-hydroxylase